MVADRGGGPAGAVCDGGAGDSEGASDGDAEGDADGDGDADTDADGDGDGDIDGAGVAVGDDGAGGCALRAGMAYWSVVDHRVAAKGPATMMLTSTNRLQNAAPASRGLGTVVRFGRLRAEMNMAVPQVRVRVTSGCQNVLGGCCRV